MKKNLYALLTIVLLFSSAQLFSQINSGNPAVPFGSNTSYNFGIMPTNLPTGGTYGRSQAAATAYNAWITSYYEECTGGGTFSNTSRIKFDQAHQTVSEGIAYGMLLTVYAGDKAKFDRLWRYYKAASNSRGIMHWMVDGCNGNARDNGATDAELDAAHALMIASEQWPNSSTPWNYRNEALALLDAIRQYEIHPTSYQTLNGDAWGSGNTCRNPSYQSPAYYRQYAIFQPTRASFWEQVTTAAETLLGNNRNNTTGLVSNWCDNNGTPNGCGPNNPGVEYGSDACRTPWRMAKDVIWHGPTTAARAFEMCQKMANWLNGHENNMRGPLPMNAANPGAGAHRNGSYTTYALAPMALTTQTAQTSLNTAYTNVAGLGPDGYYFNETIRCITLFMLTGNFWKPGTSGVAQPPVVLSATTNADGSRITITFSQDMATPASNAHGNFTLRINGTVRTGAFTAISRPSAREIQLTVAGTATPIPGDVITLSYSPGTVQNTTGTLLAAFTNSPVINALAGNSVLIDDFEDNDNINNLGGTWFTYSDAGDNGASTIIPTTSSTNPFTMTTGGANGSNYHLRATYTLNKGGFQWDPYVGVGMYPSVSETTTVNWSTGTGISFYYRGNACSFRVIIPTVTDYGYHQVAIPATASWTKYTVNWNEFTQPTWATARAFTPNAILQLQWQVEGSTGNTGEIRVDDVMVEGMPPVNVTGITLSETALQLMVDDEEDLTATFAPANATYKVIIWESSDPTVATVDNAGSVTAIGEGVAIITATAKMHSTVVATCHVTVGTPEVFPTSVSVSLLPTSIPVGGTSQATATVLPANTTNKNVTWTSSNTAVATINANGVITGVAPGTSIIRARCVSDNTVTATATITVTTVPPSTVSVSLLPTSIQVGETSQATATVLPENTTDKSVIWSSNNTAVATVNASGVVTGVAPGTAIIRARCVADNTVTATATITVTAVPPSTVSVSLLPTSIQVGETSQATATVLPANTTDKSVTWTSENTAVATVNASGVITGVAPGTAIIRARCVADNTVTATATITVTAVPPSTVSVSLSPTSIQVEQTSQATATVLPANTTDKSVTWTSENTAVATVNASGVITGVAPGTAIIRARCVADNTVTATATITVTAVPPSTVSVSLSPTSIQVEQTSQATATVLPANTTDKSVTWTSENTAVATVNASGVITGVAPGTAIIRARCVADNTVTATATITVTAIPPSTVSVSLLPTSIQVGQTSQATATVLPANATDKSVTWTSENTAVATVNASGVITGVAPGTAIIRARCVADNTVTATATITVNPTAVESISVSPTSAIIVVGQTVTATPTILPPDATNKTVTWESSNIAIATVTPNGLISAISSGTVTITVISNDNPTLSATISIECVNKSVLLADITAAQTLHDDATEGASDGMYPAGSKATLQSAINAANTVYNNANATQAQVNQAIADLADAVQTFEASIVVVNRTELASLISSAQSTHDAAVEGDLTGEYPAGSKATLQTAIADATIVYNATLSTQVQINQARTQLQTALDVFLASVNTTDPVDKTDLGLTITHAQSIHDAAVEGSADGQYPTGSKATLQSAINAATTVYNDNSANQSQVNVARINLEAAIADFEAAEISVDKSVLVSAIANAQSIHDAAVEGSADGQYPTGSKATLQSAINAASAVNTNALASQADVNAAVADLNAALATFQASVIGVDKSALVSAISNAQSVHDAAVEGSADGQYPAGSKATLQSAINAASAVNTNALASQADVNAAVADLNAALATFQASVIGVDKSALVSAISNAQSVHDAAVEGSADGQYPAGSKATLQSAINAASAVNTNALASQADVNAAVADLNAALATFQASVIGVDKSALVSAISNAQSVHDAAVEGSADGQYPAGSKATLQSAINAASAVNTNALASQADVNAAVADLNAALATFQASVIGVDKSALVSAISNAQSVHDAAVEGSADGQYPAGSKATLQSAINAASAVNTNALASQAEVNAAVADLNAALAAFQASIIGVDKSVLVSTIANAQNVHDAAVEGSADGQYPAGSKATLQSAINAASAVNTNALASQAEVDEAVADLNAALAAFQASVIGVDKSALAAKIQESSAIHNQAIEGNGDGQYEYGSKSALMAVIIMAMDVEDNIASTQADVNQAIADLDAALQVFATKIISVNRNNLASLIQQAQALHANAVEGEGDGMYPTGSKATLQNAINTAQDIYDIPTASQDIIDEAYDDLQHAITAFEGVVIQVNKTALATAISNAEAVNAAALVGTTEGFYPQAAKDAFTAAITAAQAVYTNPASSQAQVNQAITTLNQAVIDFEAQVIPPAILYTYIATNELDQITELLTYWFTYTDNEDGGASIVTPPNGAPFYSVSPGAAGTDSTARIDFELNKANYAWNPFVGFGFNTQIDETQSFDFSGTDGFSFYHRGNSCVIEIIQYENMGDFHGNDTYWNTFQKFIPPSTDWTHVHILWSEFARPNWGTEYDLDIAGIYKFQWKHEGSTGAQGFIEIDQVAIMGTVTLPTVSKTQLTALIQEALDIHDAAVIGNAHGQYSQASKTNFANAIEIAQAVEGNPGASQEQVDAAVAELQIAIATFQASAIVVSKTQLQQSIQLAQNFHNSAVEGTADGQYPAGSKATLQNAINAAQAVNTNPLATQAEVNSAKQTLDNALVAFQNQVIGVNKGQLFVKISEATTLHSESVEGTLNGQYPVGSKATLQNAINTAQAVYDDSNVSQTDVNTAVTNLQTAISHFESLRISIAPLEKAALAAKIQDAQNALALADGNTGNNSGNYPLEAVNNITAAIISAQNTYNTATVQSELDNAVITLQTAINIFLASVVPEAIDKTALLAAIESAESTINSVETGNNPGQYPQSVWIEYYNVIQTSRNIYNKTNATQAEVDNQVIELQQAYVRFITSVVPLSISEVTTETKVYPNPFVSTIHVTSNTEISSVTLVSLLGETVVSVQVQAEEVSLSLDNTSIGIYILLIEYSNGRSESVRITKK